MKKPMLKNAILVLLFFPLLGFTQSSAVSSLFEKYTEQDGFTSVEVSKGLFELFSEIEADDPEFDEFQKAVEGIEQLKLLAYSVKDDGSESTKNSFHDEIMKTIPFKEYKELMVVKDNDANINFYAKSEGSIISEMIMVVDGDDEEVLLSLTGNINLNHVAKLGSAMKLGGMEHLGKMHQSE